MFTFGEERTIPDIESIYTIFLVFSLKSCKISRFKSHDIKGRITITIKIYVTFMLILYIDFMLSAL